MGYSANMRFGPLPKENVTDGTSINFNSRPMLYINDALLNGWTTMAGGITKKMRKVQVGTREESKIRAGYTPPRLRRDGIRVTLGP